jgi:hypothetical protein
MQPAETMGAELSGHVPTERVSHAVSLREGLRCGYVVACLSQSYVCRKEPYGNGADASA